MSVLPSVISDYILVNTTTAVSQARPDLIFRDDGTFVITWTDNSRYFSDDYTIDFYGQIFDSSGNKIGEEKLILDRDQVDGLTPGRDFDQYTAKASSDGSIYVVFSDGMGFDISSDITSYELVFEGNYRYSQTYAEYTFSSVSDKNLLFIIDSGGSSVDLQEINENGGFIDIARLYRFEESPDLSQSIYDMHVQNYGEMLLVYFTYWKSNLDNTNYSVKYIIQEWVVEPDGEMVLGREHEFDPKTALYERSIAANGFDEEILKLASGGFVFFYNDSIPAENGFDLPFLAQRYTSDLIPVGDPIIVSAEEYSRSAAAYNTKSIALSDGGFVVAWAAEDGSQASSLYSIYLRFFGPDGMPTSDALRLSYTSISTFDIGLNIEGDVVITWDGFRLEDELDPEYLAVNALIFDPGSSSLSIVGSSAGDDLFGGNNADYLVGFAGADHIAAGNGNDFIEGGSGNDTLIGGLGLDTLIGGADADVLDGGGGFDTADYSGSAAGVTIDLIAGTGIGGDAEGDTLTGIERIYGSMYNDTLKGNGFLYGNAGNETFIGTFGRTTYVGDAGFDTVDYSESASAVTVNLLTTMGSGGDADGDRYYAIERVIGSTHDDTLTGNGYLYGNAGNDTFIGTSGRTTYVGDAGFDTVDYSGSASAVTVNLLTTMGTGGDADSDRYYAIERVIGSTHDDTLIGNGYLYGNAGNDTFIGTAGATTYVGDAGFDTVDYSGSGAGVSVNLMTTTGAGGDADGDRYYLIERVLGSAHEDTLAGNGYLYGNGGGDMFNDGSGNSVYIGGAGDDTYVFADNYGTDRIWDFGAGGDADVIDLSGVTAIEDYTDLIDNHAANSGTNVTITDGVNVITIMNTQIGDLLETDFDFGV